MLVPEKKQNGNHHHEKKIGKGKILKEVTEPYQE
jgi:hypothetical protein